MKLSELLSVLPAARATRGSDPEVLSLADDSRKVGPGGLFFALSGSAADGNRFVRHAVENGAVAVLSELPPPPAPFSLGSGGASGGPARWIEVPDALEAMSSLAARFYGEPSRRLRVVGATGTNGKTTTTYFLESVWLRAGAPCGVIGTVEHRLRGRRLEEAGNTTPLSLDLQRLLRRMGDAGATHAALEVSSHALALKRAEHVEFDAAVFTNLRRDHLDFHKTREAYLEAKARLFELLCRASSSKRWRVAVLNRDDPAWTALRRRVTEAEIVTYGTSPQADVRAEAIEPDPDGTRFRLRRGAEEWFVRLKLAGEHNVHNALAAAATCLWLGCPPREVVQGLEALESVPGRLEPVRAGQPFHVYVDYAHTDSALESVLLFLGKIPHRRIITVFGCGGDRDRGKRGPMGAAACKGSDLAVVTSDNPRGEDPLSIIAQIEAGIKTAGRQNYRIVSDRGEAIREALRAAGEGDIVLIAGKGHEAGQIVKGRTLPFDDREAARRALRELSPG